MVEGHPRTICTKSAHQFFFSRIFLKLLLLVAMCHMYNLLVQHTRCMGMHPDPTTPLFASKPF